MYSQIPVIVSTVSLSATSTYFNWKLPRSNLNCIMSGRKADPIWYHFEKLTSKTATGCRAKCKNCGFELQGLVQRMKKHYDKCTASNDDVTLEPEQSIAGKFFFFTFIIHLICVHFLSLHAIIISMTDK